MANISATMVKELRERTGAGMMDCKAALGETSGDMEQAVDLLRKKGLGEGRQEGRPGRRRGPRRARRRGHQGRPRRTELGDRFRRAQRPVPGPGQDDRQRRAERRHRPGEDQGRQGRQHHRGGGDRRHHCQDRREHDAAARRLALGRQGRRSEATCTAPWSRASARSAFWSRWNSTGNAERAQAVRPHGRDARRRLEPAGDRSVGPRSGRRAPREGRARRQVQGARQARRT